MMLPLNFHPRPGALLMCDFSGFQVPEMIKVRPVVVISPRRRRRSSGLCTVVPLSTKAPNPVEPFHHRMDPRSVPVELGPEQSWAKCDMLYTVSLKRLSRVKGPAGRHLTPQVLPEDLDAVREGVLKALGWVAESC